MPNGQPAIPDIVYAAFAAPIDANAPSRIIQGLATAVQGGVQEVHLLFHSYGGNVGDGICLYNFFRSLPISLTLYNVGNISSAAAIAFLGAQKRQTSAHATFMVHRTQAAPQPATAERLHALTQSVLIDDERTETILRQHITLTDEQWCFHKVADLWFTAKQAVECGLATLRDELT